MVVNKLAVHAVPAPSFVTAVQLAACATLVGVAAQLQFVEFKGFEMEKIKCDLLPSIYSHAMRVDRLAPEMVVCTAVRVRVGREGAGLSCHVARARRPFMVYIFGFALSLYSNMRALQETSVETVIVFRSCVPMAVSILEWMFLGRRLPNARGGGALCVIGLGTLQYVRSDSQFKAEGAGAYLWVTVYYLTVRPVARTPASRQAARPCLQRAGR